jgi:methionyl-tRNA synthetase
VVISVRLLKRRKLQKRDLEFQCEGWQVQTTHPNDSTKCKFIKSTELNQIPVIVKLYAGLTIRKENNQINKWIGKYEKQIKNKYSEENWRKVPLFSGYIKLHDKYSAKKGLRSSSGRLIDLILKRGSISNINTFVDIYNVVSAFTGISMGAHDISKIAGSVRFEVLGEDIEFETIGGGKFDIARKGEYCYIDDKGILCRLDIKQTERTKITEKTREVFAIFQGHESLGEVLLRQGVDLLEEGINKL